MAKKGGWWRPVVLVAALIAILVLARVFGIGEKLGALRGWIESLGPWGPLVFLLIYIAAVVAALPRAAITVAAGALFGSVVGVILVSIGATVGASLAFLISRYFARDVVANWLSKNEKFQKLDKLTEEHGAIMVALTRLMPIFPFNLLNYGFGLTRVPFWTYVFWSWLCMLPGTALYGGGGRGYHGPGQGAGPLGADWRGIGVAVVLAILVTVAKRKLQAKEMKMKVPVPPEPNWSPSLFRKFDLWMNTTGSWWPTCIPRTG